MHVFGSVVFQNILSVKCKITEGVTIRDHAASVTGKPDQGCEGGKSSVIEMLVLYEC